MDFISDELVRKDQNECFKRLFQYPPLESMTTLINLAEKIKDRVIQLENQQKLREKERLQKKEENKKLNQTKNSMTNFFFGAQSPTPMQVTQMPIPMFVNNSNMFLTPQYNQNIPNQMFQKTNLVIGNKDQSYQVTDNENKNLLKEIKDLVYKYKDVYAKQDKMKMDFLIDKLEKNI